MKDLDLIKKMIEHGFVLNDIRQRLELTIDEIKEIKNMGFSLKLEKYSEDKNNEIMELYEKGVSMTQLSLKYSVHGRIIKALAKERGIFRQFKDTMTRKKYDQKAFVVIDTPNQYAFSFVLISSK